jgi:hypothetical protein
MRIKITALLAGLALVGCRSSDVQNGGDGGSGSDSGSGGGTKIQDIQNDTMPKGTPVSLIGKVVTAVDTFGTTIGNIWVEETEGGLNSGVLIFNKANAIDVSTLVPGDIVNVTGGVKDEFALTSDTSGNTDTEIDAPAGGALMIIKTGHGSVPAPVMLDALAIGQMSTVAERTAALEPYEGVLVTVTNIEEFGAPKNFSKATPPPVDDVDFNATGTLVVEDSLSAFPSSFAAQTCISTITGVVDYFFNYLLLPRSDADIGATGTGCAPPEQSNLCSDGIDNDGNGFSDCLDLGCEVGANAFLGASCAPADAMCGCSKNLASGTSVNIVNTTAGTATIGPVILNNVFVTGVTSKGLWVSDSLTGAANNGVFVFTGAAPTATVGQKLATVQGLAGPFNPSKIATAMNPKLLVEVSDATVGTASAGGTTVGFASIAATVSDLTTGAPFAGSLVKLTNVKVKTAGLFGQFTLVDNAGGTVTLADTAFSMYTGVTITAGTTCFASLTGVMNLDTSDTPQLLQVRTINPRSAADMVVASSPSVCTGT